jgi:hypothetical protein
LPGDAGGLAGDGDGFAGVGEVVPEPVVDGGLIGDDGLLVLVAGDGALLAVCVCEPPQ